MNSHEIRQNIANGEYDHLFRTLYGGAETARLRYHQAVNSFCDIFGERDNIRLFSSPGRTEISGNHTDHQHGCVIAASVNLDAIGVVSANDDQVIRIKSRGFDMETVSLLRLDKDSKERGRAGALIRGVAAFLAQKGYRLGGFDAYTTSDILKGSGLSSSAAFEVLIGTILNSLYCNNELSRQEIAIAGQFAESEYFGKPCGLLDQMASSLGGFIYADFMNPARPKTEKIDKDFKSSGYTLCVVDTGGSHSSLTNEYSDITIECNRVSKALGKEYLREVNEDEFYDKIAVLRKRCSDRAILRAFHFFHEQRRVTEQKQALMCGNIEQFLSLVNESGNSSYMYLQNLYSVSNASEQALPLALALTKKFLNGKGACRVHGGGFAGTIQCYIPSDRFNEYKAMIEKTFKKGACMEINVRPIGGCEIK